MARYGVDPSTGITTYQDYTVPTGHFALVRTLSGMGSVGWVAIDEGGGFYDIAARRDGGGNLDLGIVVDEGVTIRASGNGEPSTVHGYLIPK